MMYIFKSSYLGGGGGGGVQPKLLGKLSLEIGVYQKALPKGGSFGEVSEYLCLFALRATAVHVNGRRLELNLIMYSTHPKNNLSGI